MLILSVQEKYDLRRDYWRVKDSLSTENLDSIVFDFFPHCTYIVHIPVLNQVDAKQDE